MAGKCCENCDLYKPQCWVVIGKECAAFGSCTNDDYCGLQSPRDGKRNRKEMANEQKSIEKAVGD